MHSPIPFTLIKSLEINICSFLFDETSLLVFNMKVSRSCKSQWSQQEHTVITSGATQRFVVGCDYIAITAFKNDLTCTFPGLFYYGALLVYLGMDYSYKSLPIYLILCSPSVQPLSKRGHFSFVLYLKYKLIKYIHVRA